MKLLYLSIFLYCLSACAPPPPKTTPDKKPYVLLSASEAATVVTTDKLEGFFEKVMPLEMAVQMKKSVEDLPREEVLPDYKEMLVEDLMDFTAEEKKVVSKIMDKAMEMCYAVKNDINLPVMKLIKTKGKYYGGSVFYTRDDAIVIPEPMLRLDPNGDNLGFLSTMLHEIFHIYSRYNKTVRDSLYARLGFERLHQLELSDFLKERVLYNPDGVDLRYAITVKDENQRSFKAVPVIYSQYKKFNPERPAFFGYLVFQLFEIEEKDGVWKVVNENVGYSIDDISGFWEQVTENTRYNIHPDELCADNFVILAKSKKDDFVLNNLAADGKKLVADFESILKNN